MFVTYSVTPQNVNVVCFQVGYVMCVYRWFRLCQEGVFSGGICDVCVLLVETYKQKRKKGTERVNSDHSPIPLLKREVKASNQYRPGLLLCGICGVLGCLV